MELTPDTHITGSFKVFKKTYQICTHLIFLCFSGLPHLAVSSSTPPPSTSPLPVKIKSEPISPPREHHMTNSSSGGSSGSNNIHLNAISHSHQHVHSHTLNLTHPHHTLPRPNSTGQLTPTPGEYLKLI